MIKIIYENEDFLVIDKPAGMVVHEGAGETVFTVTQWLIDKYPQIKKYQWPPLRQGFAEQADQTKAGIVHRLDKDTSGLLILAKNPEAQKTLQKQFQEHQIQKTYLALVLGPVSPEKGEIITKIFRSNRDFRLKKTSILNLDQSAKTAISQYKVIKKYNFMAYSLWLMAIRIITGRTHQIRTQMKYKGWPIIGDQQYNSKISRRVSDELDLHRQFLHAQKLEFCYNGKEFIFRSDLPQELEFIISKIK